jgi:tetratricopeptide (TPR) repeat protein
LLDNVGVYKYFAERCAVKKFFLFFPAGLLASLLTVLGFSNFAEAQGTRQPTPAAPSTITRPDSIQDSGLYGYWNNMSNQGRAGGGLLGKVAVEGEPLLWNPILVSVICNGTAVYTTQTDPKGNFQIAFAAVTGTDPQRDAQRQAETHYEGCAVQASYAGFHSGAITITPHNLRDDPNLGTVTLSRAGGREAGTAVSSTTESAPAGAVKAFEKAREELLQQKPDRAEKDLEKAVQVYPSFAEAWYQLGRLQQAENSGDARNSYAKAAAADPKFILPYEPLAGMAAQDGKWQDVADATSHSLQLDPEGTAKIWYWNGLANFQLGKRDVAEASVVKALAMDPSHTIPNTEQLLAVILTARADYAEALAHLRNCLTYVPSGASADLVKQQITFLETKVGGAK